MSYSDPFINSIFAASRKASVALIRDFGEVEKLQVSLKGVSDFVSKADIKAENTIIRELSSLHPKINIHAEETGNIKNSVNFPDVQLARTTINRIAITNKNVPTMIGQIATALGDLDLNIADMTNVSKGEIAYNLIDIENKISCSVQWVY